MSFNFLEKKRCAFNFVQLSMIETREVLINGFWFPYCSDEIKKQLKEVSIRFGHLQEEFCSHVFEDFDKCPLRWDRHSLVEYVS